MLNKRMLKKCSFFVIVAMFFVVASTGISATNQDSPVFIGWESISGEPYPKNENDNISRTNEESISPDFVVDSKGNIHVVWSERPFHQDSEICYLKWDGFIWFTADGSVYDTKNAYITNDDRDSRTPSIVLDSNDIPYIAWIDGAFDESTELFCLKLVDGQLYTVSGNRYQSTDSDINISKTRESVVYLFEIMIDSKDNPHFCWSETWYGIYYTRWNGQEFVNIENESAREYENRRLIKLNDSDYRFDCQLVEDCLNLVFCDKTSQYYGSNLYFVKWDGAWWVNIRGEKSHKNFDNCTIINTPQFLVSGFAMQIDKYGCIHFIWQNERAYGLNYSMNYLMWDGVDFKVLDEEIYRPELFNSVTFESEKRFFVNSFLLQDDDVPILTWYFDDIFEQGIHINRLYDKSVIGIDGSVLDMDHINTFGAMGSLTFDSKIDFDNSGNMFFIRADFSYENCEIVLTKIENGREKLLDGEEYNPSAGNINLTCSRNSGIDHSFDLYDDEVYVTWSSMLYSSTPDNLNFIKWDGENWVNFEGEKWNYKNSSITDYESSHCFLPKIKLGVDGKPYIMWFEKNFGEDAYDDIDRLHLIWWDGESWRTIDNKVFGGLNSALPDYCEYAYMFNFCLDQNSRPHIVWEDQGYINYMYWDGNTWKITNGDDYGANYGDEAIYYLEYSEVYDLKPSFYEDKIGVSWSIKSDETNTYTPYYLEKNISIGSPWKTIKSETFDIDGELDCDIVEFKSDVPVKIIPDKDSNLHFTWTQVFDDTVELKYCKWDGEKFTCINGKAFNFELNGSGAIAKMEIGMTKYGKNIEPFLTIDDQNLPHIVWNQVEEVFENKISNSSIMNVYYARLIDGNWVNIFSEILSDDAKNAKISNSSNPNNGFNTWGNWNEDPVQIKINYLGVPIIMWADLSYSFRSVNIHNLKGSVRNLIEK